MDSPEVVLRPDEGVADDLAVVGVPGSLLQFELLLQDHVLFKREFFSGNRGVATLYL